MTKSTVDLNKAKAGVPKLRFPEFRNVPGWTPRFGGDLFDQISNREAPAGLPILAITQEHGAIPRDEIDYHVSVTDRSVETYKEVCVGDFIISLRSFQGGIEYSNYHGICSPAYVILRKKVKQSDEFFKHLFKSYRFIQQLTKNLEGLRDGKMISYRQFSDIQIACPELAEQQKIAECLGSLDEMIAAEREKLEALKAYKKGLMQQLFPREGETVPRLRFPEFRGSGGWNATTLEYACDLQAGKFVPAAEIKERSEVGFFPCYGGNGLRGYTSTYTHEGVYPLVGRQGALCGNVKLGLGKFHATEHALVAAPKSGVDVGWLYHALDYLKLNRFATGQAQPGLSVDVLNKVPMAIPDEEDEQRKIADTLASFDGIIETQNNRLKALQEQKQSLMQQLFPPQEVES